MVLALLTVLAGTAACGSEEAGAAASTSSSAPSTMPADAITGRLAELEFARQCTVDATNRADEAAFTTELDQSLAEAGLTHEQWKEWHDALADSPELVTQFAEAGAAGCPAG
jgi:hypothetical protein